MKNKIFKIVPVLIAGVSLTSCTVLSDLGIGGKGDITKFARHRHEVSLREFIEKAKDSVKKTDYVKDDYKMPDSKLIAGIKAEATQKLTNDRLKNKTRNQAEVKLDLTADGSFDRDNDSLKAKVEGSYSASVKNAVIGESSNKFNTKLDATFIPNGKDIYGNTIYAGVDNKNQVYRNYAVGEGFDLGNALSFGMNRIMNSLAKMSIDESFSEAEFNRTISQYGLSLKYYDDSNVMTVTAEWKYSVPLQEEYYHYESRYNEQYGYWENIRVIDGVVKYGEINIDADLKFQFKVVKVVKLRASFDGELTANYTQNHLGSMNVAWPFGITGLAGDCDEGDKEVIKLKASAGINLEHEKVNNKLPDLGSYYNSTPESRYYY